MLRLYTNIPDKEGVTIVCLVQFWPPAPLSLYVTQRRRERVLPHTPYHHAREVKIFARKNFSQQITVKTLKNSLSVVFKTLTLCSYNFWQGAGFESCSVAFLFSFCLSLFCFVFVFVLFAYLFCFCCLLDIYGSRAKILYLWINNLNYYRFLQFHSFFIAIYFTKLKH